METATLPPSSEEGKPLSSSSGKPPAADEKVLADLGVLQEKLETCDSFLRPSNGERAAQVTKSDNLLEVIGFLEACAPRMVELVEAAAQGALTEPVLMECLQVNDRLTKALEDIEAVTLVEEAAPTTQDSLDALLGAAAAATPAAAAAKTDDSAPLS